VAAWPLVPFSGGPGIFPGRNVVLFLTSAMLAALIGERTLRLKDAYRMPPGCLPGTLDNYTLRFDLFDSDADLPARLARGGECSPSWAVPGGVA
jgi:hypothetical protein